MLLWQTLHQLSSSKRGFIRDVNRYRPGCIGGTTQFFTVLAACSAICGVATSLQADIYIYAHYCAVEFDPGVLQSCAIEKM